MISCQNVSCELCCTAAVTKQLVCGYLPQPTFVSSSSDTVDNLIFCTSFVQRPPGHQPVVLINDNDDDTVDPLVDEYGMYPGQLQPAIDHTDVDPEEATEATNNLTEEENKLCLT